MTDRALPANAVRRLSPESDANRTAADIRLELVRLFGIEDPDAVALRWATDFCVGARLPSVGLRRLDLVKAVFGSSVARFKEHRATCERLVGFIETGSDPFPTPSLARRTGR